MGTLSLGVAVRRRHLRPPSSALRTAGPCTGAGGVCFPSTGGGSWVAAIHN